MLKFLGVIILGLIAAAITNAMLSFVFGPIFGGIVAILTFIATIFIYIIHFK